MSPTNRFASHRVLVAVLVGLLLAGCSGIATKDIEAERTSLHREPIEMSAKGLPDVSIDASGAVKIGSGHLALTNAQRRLTQDYRAAVVELADLALTDASRVANRAMTSAIFGMLTGRLDHAEKKIDKQAEAITHTPQFCSRLGHVRQQQERMVQSVVKLSPYAKVTRQDVDDCKAGRSYQVHI